MELGSIGKEAAGQILALLFFQRAKQVQNDEKTQIEDYETKDLMVRAAHALFLGVMMIDDTPRESTMVIVGFVITVLVGYVTLYMLKKSEAIAGALPRSPKPGTVRPKDTHPRNNKHLQATAVVYVS